MTYTALVQTFGQNNIYDEKRKFDLGLKETVKAMI
jgi:hypothetical protein